MMKQPQARHGHGNAPCSRRATWLLMALVGFNLWIVWLVVTWWFQTWLLFSISYMGCHPSHWLIFFKMVTEPPTRRVNEWVHQGNAWIKTLFIGWSSWQSVGSTSIELGGASTAIWGDSWDSWWYMDNDETFWPVKYGIFHTFPWMIHPQLAGFWVFQVHGSRRQLVISQLDSYFQRFVASALKRMFTHVENQS